jgi:hypothetical protein
MYRTGVTQGWYYEVYSDSTVKYDATGFQNLYGMGMSFDPTSGAFSTNANDLTAAPDFAVERDDAYRIDSVFTFFKYMRQASTPASVADTLQIDVVRTSTANPHAYKRQYAASADGVNVNSVDSIMRFASATYQPDRNQISDSTPAAHIYRFKQPLTAAFWADSTTAGNHQVQFAIPNFMQVDSNQKVVTYVSFKRGGAAPAFGTLIDNVNHIRLFAYEHNGPDTYPQQFGQDFTSLLWATKQSKYAPPYNPYNISGHRALIPMYAYADVKSKGIPPIQFFVTCPQCDTINTIGVKSVAGNVKNVRVSPNPANDQVSVAFTLAANADVNVSLTNLVGQVVATERLGAVKAGTPAVANFNTSNLPSGVYIYTVDAGGEKMTNRLVVSH